MIKESLWRDIRYSARRLGKRRGFSLVVILTLGLGLGANTAIFSVVNGVLLHKLPYANPDKLAMIWETTSQSSHNPMSAPNFADYRDQNHVFSSMAALTARTFTIQTAAGPTLTRAGLVTPGFFELLGLQPMLGRTFLPSEGEIGNDGVVILSHSYWVQNFNSDLNVIGKSINLDCVDRGGMCSANTATTCRIIGVMPADFNFEVPGYFRNPSMWRPNVIVRDNVQRTNSYLKIIGRLKPDIDIRQAQMDMNRINADLQKNFPVEDAGLGVQLVDLHDQIVGNVRPTLLLVSGIVFFILLIICVNITNLQLEHNNFAQKEIALRIALGAKLRDLVQQLLLESWLLSMAGGILGVAVAAGLLKWFGLFADDIPRGFAANLNARVLGMSFLLSLLTTILIGAVPAIQTGMRLSVVNSLKDMTRSSPARGFGRVRDFLVVAELAMSMVLLIASGLLVKSLSRVLEVPLGFETKNVLAARIQLPSTYYADGTQQLAFYRQAMEQVKGLPGVQSAGGIDDLPLQGSGDSETFFIEGRPVPQPNELPEIQIRTVTPEYFTTIGIPLMRGRTFASTDSINSPPVVMINRAFAEKYFKNDDPVGQRIRLGTISNPSAPMTVEGIVGNSRDIRLEAAPAPEIFRSYDQFPLPYMNLAVRSQGDPRTLTPLIRKTLKGLDTKLPAFAVTPMTAEVERGLEQRRSTMFQVNLFGFVALGLAAMGIYGVVAYSTTQRTREIGIRMALGARRTNVLALILKQGISLAIGGIVVGAVISLASNRVIGRFIFGVSTLDISTYALVIAVLMGVVLLASYLPARRATRVNPIIALRYE